jgi:hypothetical protein
MFKPAARTSLGDGWIGLDEHVSQQSAFESVLATGASIYVLSWTEIILGEAQKSQREKGYLHNRAGEINDIANKRAQR